MARDSSGNYSLPPGYYAEVGQPILPSQHNPPLEDIAQALTGSLPRNGTAPMTGPLRAASGDVTAPGLAFSVSAGTGFYFTGTSVALAINGAKALEFTTQGLIGLPLGTPVPVLDDTLPGLCIWADGRNVARTTYAQLFAKWGSKYGAGDGSTTFGMPDLRGRLLIGRDNIGGTDAGRLTNVPASSGNRLTTGSILGEAFVALLLANMPAHNHSGGTTDLQGLHFHTTTNYTQDGASGVGSFARGSVVGGVTGSDGIHGHNVFLPSQGSGAAHNNVQPSLACNWAIFAGA